MADKGRRSSSTQATLVDRSSTRPTTVSLTDTEAGNGDGRAGEAYSAGSSRLRLIPQGELGAGGQGKVLKAFDPNLGRVVAMKVLAPRLRKTPASLRRFVEEARVMAQLDHPNIIPIHDLVVEDGAAHFVMKLVRGRTLDSLVQERHAENGEANATPLRQLLVTFLKVCDALAFAHDRNIIHCDLKPDNIMVGEFGEAYLMDWGIAAHPLGTRATAGAKKALSVRGTPDFMSPEQATGHPGGPTKRSDVFGLGAVLYFILTGIPPFGAKTARRALARAKTCAYDDPETVMTSKPPPPALARVVRKAMARDPNDRYASVLELRDDVDRLLHGDWHLPTKTYSRATVIVREGAWADAAYIIMSGSCVVWREAEQQKGEERRILRTLGPGAVFGETAILSGNVRTATVETLDEVVVRVVTREMFQDHLGVDSWLGKFVLALADRFRELEQRVAPGGCGTAEPRSGA